ncbi:MAG: 4-hydroxybenzoyl-CoA reductase subunit beta [Alphaproteobacteria bacterium]|nr:4-hydroxybenzoyl-CoA reductase subunit beta [Alphaproteobacteria bacterium]
MTALPPFELIRATSLAEVVAARRSHPGCRLLAGGSDLIANLRRGLSDPPALVDITGLPGMQEIAAEANGVRIGAGVTLSRLVDDPLIRRYFPALVYAITTIAGPAHRTSATLGGNLCLDTRCIFYNQSDWWRHSNGFCLKYRGTVCHTAPTGHRCHAAYSGDTAPVLLVLGARAELGGGEGRRSIALNELFRDDGAAHLTLGSDEMLLSVWIPIDSGLVAGYEKMRFRGAIDFPLAGVAVSLRRKDDILADLRIALTGTNSRPLLVSGCEALVGRPVDAAALQQIGKLVQKQVSPMRTTLAPAQYRRRVGSALACRLTGRLFAAAAESPFSA